MLWACHTALTDRLQHVASLGLLGPVRSSFAAVEDSSPRTRGRLPRRADST